MTNNKLIQRETNSQRHILLYIKKLISRGNHSRIKMHLGAWDAVTSFEDFEVDFFT